MSTLSTGLQHHRAWQFALAFLLGLSLLLAGPAQPAAASCGGTTTVGNETQLNAAIAAFNAVGAGPCVFTIQLSGNIPLTASTTTINNATGGVQLVIEGGSHTLNGQNILDVRPVTIAANTRVTINNLTVTGGNAFDGGGIDNNGNLTVTNSTISGNKAYTTDGGGIRSSGSGASLVITNSTIANNTSDQWGGGVSSTGTGSVVISGSTIAGNVARAAGGGIFQDGSAMMTVQNSTISGNSTTSSTGFAGGGGIKSAAALTLDSVTVTGNTAPFGGALDVENALSAATIRNSILANSAGSADCRISNGAALTDGGHNLVEAAGSCTFSAGTSIVGSDPVLGLLQSNGGSTQTHALLPGSPAIDAGDTTLTTDQRGVARPHGAADDIGAYEVGPQTGPNFVVNSAADTDDGSCDTLGSGNGNKDCTLREAINAANARSGADTITFNIPNGGACSSANTCTITLGAVLPQITSDMTIDGNTTAGEQITLNGNDTHRIMYVLNAALNLNALTFTRGKSSNAGGGALYVQSGTVNLTNSTFRDNVTDGPGAAAGGAIVNAGTMNVTNSTFSGNSTNGSFNGGAIWNIGALNVTNSTFSGNSAKEGGGIYGAVASSAITLTNTIIANSTGGDCAIGGGTLTADDYNIDSDGTCDNASQFTTAEIALGPLADNGGPTWTMAIDEKSVAWNYGDNTVCAAAPVNNLDQRGQTRPQGIDCDTGAYEFVYGGWQTGPNFVVNSAADTEDGSCDVLGQGVYSQDCTLREAILAANARSGADTITFNIPSGGACLSANTCTITLGGSLPQIQDALTIDGASNNGHITVDGATSHTVFDAENNFNLNALTVANGFGLLKGAGLHISSGTIDVLVSNSTFVNNRAQGGGHIKNLSSGTVRIVNSTFFDTPTTGIGHRDGTMLIYNSTLNGNNRSGSTGVEAQGGTVALYNTIVANHEFQDCYATGGTLTADANNLDEDGTCDNATQKTLAEINLQALADNGGPTRTMTLGKGSAALDAGNDAVCAAAPVNGLDQRGVTRPQGAQCDVGAVEMLVELTVTTVGSGSALVSSTPAGIGCSVGATCTMPASAGTVITLTATPATGTAFQGWSGAGCSGTGTCVLTTDSSKQVTATFTALGTVVIRKTTAPSGGSGFAFSGDLGAFTLKDRGKQVVSGLLPGTYTVREDDPSATGFALSGLICTDSLASGQPSSGDVASRTATIRLDPGETVSCSFTNSQPNTISVEKVTIPDSTDSFAFNGGALGSFNVTAGSAHIIANAAAGSYTVTEADPAPAGYRLTKASCTDSATGQTTPGNLTTRSVTMTMTAGARIHCTFENTKLGIVVIRKASAPVGGSGFSFSGDFGAFVMKDGSKKVFRGVVPGSFSVTEDDPSGLGYQLSELTCTDSVQSGKPSTGTIATRTATINMEPGETVACTFVNAQDDIVTVNAVTVPDSTASFSFDGSALGAFSVTVGQPHVVPGVAPGSYTITQADPSAAGYTVSRISCTDSATGQTFSGNLTTRSVSLTMAPGERVSCTFENTTQAPRDLYFPIVAKQ